MIYIGYPDHEKRSIIAEYRGLHDIAKVVVISPRHFPFCVEGADCNEFHDVIEYVTFYRLLQFIDTNTLVVVNECLRTQNRYELNYNVIRLFLSQTRHQLIFNQLPIIDTVEDFMILFDFDTRSQWKRQAFDESLIRESQISVRPFDLQFCQESILVSGKTQDKYATEREKLFSELGDRDPNIIPRNLYLLGGAEKAKHVHSHGRYVARNQRLKINNVITYDDVKFEDAPYRIVELPHRFIDFSDFLKTTWQTDCRVMVADLKVDHWYFERYMQWRKRLHDAYSSL